jgi:L,D-transpeptidase ErfK/SrfK
MLQRQSNPHELLRRSFMLTSLAAAILLISVRGQINLKQNQPLPMVLPAIAVPPPPPLVQTVPKIRRNATLNQRDLPRAALHRITAEVRRFKRGLGMGNRARLIVDLSDRTVSLYDQGELVTQYPVAIGQTGWETPTGLFQVRNMNTNPQWQHPLTGEIVPPGTKNPLGSRWIGFWSDGTNEIGFHGTNESNLIGLAVSHGCIRMLDGEIQQMYAQVRIGTPVTVQP